jgi:hypothetical protein
MRKMVVFAIIAMFVVALAAPAFAQEAQQKSSFKQATKDTARYGGGVVTGSVNTVGEAAYGTTKAAVSPFQSMWNWMTGKGKAEKIVTDPVEKSGRTVYDATVNTGKTVTGQKR